MLKKPDPLDENERIISFLTSDLQALSYDRTTFTLPLSAYTVAVIFSIQVRWR